MRTPPPLWNARSLHIPSAPTNRWIEAYRETELVGKREPTIRGYVATLRQVTTWIARRAGEGNQFSPQFLTEAALGAYIAEMVRAEYNMNTIGQVIAIIGGFARWLVATGELTTNPMHGITILTQSAPVAREQRESQAGGINVRETRSLLLLQGSGALCPDAEPLPALYRFDGGAFRVLRKARREGRTPNGLHLLILTGNDGLVEAETILSKQDQDMTEERARALCRDVGARLDAYLTEHCPGAVYIDLSKIHRIAIAHSVEFARLEQAWLVVEASGLPGQRRRQLTQWLESLV